MIEAACSRSHQNDMIFFTKKSIESMPVILAAGPLTSDAYSDVIMQIDDEPIDEGLSLYSGPITSVTKECMASSGPAATSQASPRHDNSSTLIDTYISDDSDYNNKQLVPYSEHSDSNNEEEPRQIKRKKRCQVNKSTWNEYKNKLNREKGREYNGRKKVNGKWERTFKNKRVLKPRCKCKTNDKTALKCCEIKEEDRKVLYEKFWGMTWGEKKVFVNSLVQEMPTKRPRNRKDPSITKRKSSMIYNLHSNDDRRVRVCKTMFQNTLCITKMTIWNWRKGKENTSNKNQNVSARKNPHEAEVESLIGFLNSIPKMESHYCRKTTAKLYLLPEWTSKRALYEFYIKDWCATRNIKLLSIAKFSNTLEIENISLFKPKKDECEKCLSHKIGNIPDTEHKEHIERKNEARIEKENDKNSEEHVFTMDTQAVLLAPKSNVSSLYYKTKLCTHNFCIFNLKNKDGFCYLWNETEGVLSSDNYATIIVKFITDKLLPSIRRVPENDVKIVLYSDGSMNEHSYCGKQVYESDTGETLAARRTGSAKIKSNSQQRQFIKTKSLGLTGSDRLAQALTHANDKKLFENFYHLSKQAQTFLMMQLRECRKNKMARRFSLKEKLMALLMMKQSPKEYKLLENMFALPSKRTLHRVSEKLSVKPGINPQIFAFIENKTKNWDIKKNFVL
ncbi:hypothetical protein ACJJTC_006818 [Scirpophaga incertulas]